MKQDYNPQEIEQAAQRYWNKNNTFKVSEELETEKFYCLSMMPYPSGKIHMGHVRNYTIGDVIARYQRMLGKNVLQPMSWDAFGLPAENAALENKVAPAKWTRSNIEHMRTELQSLGLAIDWSRELATCDPDYYRWEQWLFLKMYAKGLVYRKKSTVNWDPVDKTVLANEQVVNGRGWRSGAIVERKEISQWFLKITAYADELLKSLDQLPGWPEQVRTMQKNWIGRSKGIELDFAVPTTNSKLTVFTTRADTLLGVSYVAIAAKHPLAEQVAKSNPAVTKFIAKCNKIKVAEAELATLEKEGIATGLYAIHPITGQQVPIWIANFVIMDYGHGAVMAVPAHDQRDFEFAHKYQLPITQVIKPTDNSEPDFSNSAFIETGILINSQQFNDLTSKEAIKKIADYLIKNKKGKYKINYRLRDWGVSRQRYWGAPIPIIYCPNCGTVPVPEAKLPVVLPENVSLTEPGSPLSELTEFVDTTCPLCKAKAKRETDTFDTFMESSWYYARSCCVDQNEAILDDRANYWTPVDQYVGGIEHAVMHLLYARFIHKVIRDLGLINSDEPFTNLLTQGMVLKDGSKMSKSKGNTVSPKKIVQKYGADTARLFTIFTSPPEQSLEWSDTAVAGAQRFLRKLWNFAYQQQKIFTTKLEPLKKPNKQQQQARRQIHELLQQANFDMQKLQFNTVVSAVMKIFNLLQTFTKVENLKPIIVEGFKIILQLLNPITPHLTHSLWQQLKYPGAVENSGWPKVDKSALEHTETTIIVQVNGKLRSHLTVPINISKQQLEKIALQENNVKKFTANKTIKKVIVIPNKLINIVAL